MTPSAAANDADGDQRLLKQRSISSARKLSKNDASAADFKPTLRGQLHHASFYIFILVGIYALTMARDAASRWSFLVYWVSMLLVYGTSAVFHVTEWRSERSYQLMRKLDHANIFLLIAGTYTPVCISCLGANDRAINMLIAAWAIAIVGLFRAVFWTAAPKLISVGLYFISGLTILPFLPWLAGALPASQMVLYALGGAIYLIGGLVYGLERPDPLPNHFGYHEVFHTCTILANLCFFLPIMQCIQKGI